MTYIQEVVPALSGTHIVRQSSIAQNHFSSAFQ